MFRMYASNSHSYTHLILALGIVRTPTVWGFITSEYPGTHDIGLPICGHDVKTVVRGWQEDHELTSLCFLVYVWHRQGTCTGR